MGGWVEVAESGITVGVVHPSRLIRELLTRCLEQQPGIGQVHAYAGVDAVQERPLPEEHALLLDWMTAQRAGGPAVLALRQCAPQARVIMFNVADSEKAIVDCALLGVAGCILEDACLDEILDGIQAVMQNMAALSPRCITALMGHVARRGAAEMVFSRANLTRREEEILRLVATGLSNKEIAQQLFLRPQTVKNYVHQMLQKLGVHRRTDLIRLLSASASVSSGAG